MTLIEKLIKRRDELKKAGQGMRAAAVTDMIEKLKNEEYYNLYKK